MVNSKAFGIKHKKIPYNVTVYKVLQVKSQTITLPYKN